MRKSGNGRTRDVARPYAQTTLRATTRAGAGIVGISSARNLTGRTTLHHKTRRLCRPEPTEEAHMGDKMQRVKGKANETMGKTRVSASKTRASKSTGSGGRAQQAKGKAQQAAGKARSTAKKATR
jgi:uncharacterized protein YjbJ (UPF0337 family)